MNSYQTTLLKLFLFLLLLFLPQSIFASDKHNTNYEEDTTRTSPITHFNENVWIYTKLDDTTGYQQVFMMYHDPSTSTGYFTETILTSSPFDKKNPKWGPEVNLRSYAAFPGVPDRCNNGQTFLFLGNRDGDGNDDLYLNCIENFPTTPTLPLADDVQISGLTPPQTFDFEDYDVDYLYPKLATITNQSYYQIIFTTEISGGSGGEMHHLLFRPQRMIADGSNYYFDNLSWGAWAPIFGQYRHPKFFNEGNNIIFSAYDSSNGYWQLGSIVYSGTYEVQMTTLTSNNISHPQVTTKLRLNTVPTIVFVIEGTFLSINQLAYTKAAIDVGGTTISSWCEDIHLLSDTDANRDTFGLDPSTTTDIQASYEYEQPDGYHDIYYGYKDSNCLTTSTTTVTTTVDDFFDAEYQLTCNEDNKTPLFLADMNTNSTHTAKVTSPYDMAMLEIKLDGSDYSLVHLHNNPAPPVCEDTCYENADGSPLTTAQDADGNGIKDECETTTTTSTTSSSTASSSSSSSTSGSTTSSSTTTTTTSTSSTSSTTSTTSSTTSTTGGTDCGCACCTCTDCNPDEEEEPEPIPAEVEPTEEEVEWGTIFQGDSFKSWGCNLNLGGAPNPSFLFLVLSVNLIPFFTALFYQRKKLK